MDTQHTFPSLAIPRPPQDCINSLNVSEHYPMCTLASGCNDSGLRAGAQGPSSVLPPLPPSSHVQHVPHLYRGPVSGMSRLGREGWGMGGKGCRRGIFFPMRTMFHTDKYLCSLCIYH